MEKKRIIKIVSQKRAWYERILSAVFYSLAIYITILFYKNNPHSFTEVYYVKNIKTLSFLIFLVSFGIRFSYVINHHFNFELMKYRAYWSVGPFGFGKWKNFTNLSRVSTFLNSRNECEVNIWDIKNNKYKISVFDEIKDAVDYGRDLAKSLEIKFLERN